MNVVIRTNGDCFEWRMDIERTEDNEKCDYFVRRFGSDVWENAEVYCGRLSPYAYMNEFLETFRNWSANSVLVSV